MPGKLQQARDFNPYEKGVTVEELQKIHRQLAKVLNQRMVRLENTKSPITGEAYTFGAYDLMQDYLDRQGKKGDKLRFTESLSAGGMSKAELQKEVRKMQRFESFESSRVGGMKAIEARRAKSFTERSEEGQTPISAQTVSSKDFYDFLNSKTYEELSRMVSSDVLVEEYDRAAQRGVSREKIEAALQDYVEKARKVSIKGIRRKLRSRRIK